MTVVWFSPKYRVFEFDFRFHDVAVIISGLCEFESRYHGGHDDPEGGLDEVHSWAASSSVAKDIVAGVAAFSGGFISGDEETFRLECVWFRVEFLVVKDVPIGRY